MDCGKEIEVRKKTDGGCRHALVPDSMVDTNACGRDLCPDSLPTFHFFVNATAGVGIYGSLTTGGVSESAIESQEGSFAYFCLVITMKKSIIVMV